VTDTPILLSIEGPVATITLNRPAGGNVIDIPMAQALLRVAMICDADPSVRCVVLTGSGKLFCGGGDIAAFAAADGNVPAYLNELVGLWHMAVSRLMRMPKPLLVLVNGPAAGAGLSLALAGDLVIAARSAHFTAAHSLVGLTPDGGLTWLLPRLVGLRRATDMIVTNRRVSAEEALSIGLVSSLVEESDLMAEGMKQAAGLAASATSAIGAIRSLLLESSSSSLEDQLAREMRHIVTAGGTAECREGVTAFLDRRKPDFAGVS